MDRPRRHHAFDGASDETAASAAARTDAQRALQHDFRGCLVSYTFLRTQSKPKLAVVSLLLFSFLLSFPDLGFIRNLVTQLFSMLRHWHFKLA